MKAGLFALFGIALMGLIACSGVYSGAASGGEGGTSAYTCDGLPQWAAEGDECCPDHGEQACADGARCAQIDSHDVERCHP